jgi:hypothetical protein
MTKGTLSLIVDAVLFISSMAADTDGSSQLVYTGCVKHLTFGVYGCPSFVSPRVRPCKYGY